MPRLTPSIPTLRPILLRHCFRLSSTFSPWPSPPKLPADQQAEFERLQRAAAASPALQPSQQPRRADVQGHVDQRLFRPAPPEFEGDVNPKTGEVGGPKTDPLPWGGGGDWSYNGRVTDF